MPQTPAEQPARYRAPPASSLPSEWGTAGAFPKLTALYLDENGKLTGKHC